MDPPPYLQSHPDGTVISIKLQPRASRTAIAGPQGSELKVQVTAPPVDSAANEALVRLLAEVLDCPRSAVHLIRGRTSRHKQVLIRGVSVGDAAARL